MFTMFEKVQQYLSRFDKKSYIVESEIIAFGIAPGRVKGSLLRRHRSLDSEFNPHPNCVVAPLNKAVYDDYLCLVASNKQQTYDERSQTSTGKLGKLSSPKRVRIRPKDSATIASSGAEDKDASIDKLPITLKFFEML